MAEAADPRRSARLQFRALYRTVLREASWPFVGAVGLMLALAVSSGLAVLVLIPLVQAAGVAGLSGPSGSTLVAAVTDAVGRVPLEGALAAFVVLTAAQAWFGRLQIRQAEIVTQRVKLNLRQQLFAGLSAADWAFYTRLRSADVTDALIRQAERVGYATHALVTLGASGAVAVVYAGLALLISVPVTLLILALGGLLAVALAPRRREASRIGEALSAADRELFRTITDALSGMKLVKSAGAERRQLAAFQQTVGELHARQLDVVASPVAVRMWFDVGAAVILAAGVLLGVRVVGVAPASLVVLLVLFARLAPQLSSLQVYYQGLLTDLPALRVLGDLQDAVDRARSSVEDEPLPVGFEAVVKLESVSFAYAGPAVLADVSFEIPAGRTVALVGPSGAGKSTVADLVLGLLTPSRGRLTVDGVPLTANRLAAWRRQVAYVPQDTFLFHDTIRANLLWSDDAVSDARLAECLEAASASFVHRLPMGLDTIVGDRGVLLSGGERQRLALARALLGSPRLLVLDEATSALDSEHERAIQASLERLHGEVAILLIAHRLSTVRSADAIVVLDGGRVVERGTWSALLGRAGRFAELCDAQGVASAAADSEVSTAARTGRLSP